MRSLLTTLGLLVALASSASLTSPLLAQSGPQRPAETAPSPSPGETSPPAAETPRLRDRSDPATPRPRRGPRRREDGAQAPGAGEARPAANAEPVPAPGNAPAAPPIATPDPAAAPVSPPAETPANAPAPPPGQPGTEPAAPNPPAGTPDPATPPDAVPPNTEGAPTPGPAPGTTLPNRVDPAPAPSGGEENPDVAVRTTRPATGRTAAAPAPPAARPQGTPARRPAPLPVTPQAVLTSWRGLFERSPLGFDARTPVIALRDLSRSATALSTRPATLWEGAARLGWGFWTGLLLLGLCIAAGALLERRHPARHEAFWNTTEARAERLPMGALFVRLVRRILLPVAALLLWSLGGLITNAESPAYQFVENLLAIWTAFRLLNQLLPAQLELGRGETGSVLRLQRPFHRMLLFAAVWGVGWLTMDALRYRDEVIALWVAGGHLILVLQIGFLLLQKPVVLALLPHYENAAYRRFLGLISTIYLPLVYFSLSIALLWVVGYHNLAAVFLARSWAVVAIGLIGFALFQSVFRYAEQALPADPERQIQREQLLATVQRLAGFLILIVAAYLSLRTLGLWDPWQLLLEQPWLILGTLRITGGALWASAVVTVSLLLVSHWLQATLDFHIYPRMGIGRGEAYALNRLLHYAVIVIAVLLVLNNLGLPPTSLALVAGGLSVGLGFGLQNIANNLTSGLILLTSRQVRQGDLITVGGETGVVREVNLRATTVTTGDNLDLLIPNSKLLEETLINWTHGNSQVRMKVPFGVAYTSDPAVVEETVIAIAREHPEILAQPAPEVWFRGMGDNALQFELLAWIDLKTAVRPRITSQLYHEIFRTFRERSIDIPYPQRDLHLRSGVPWDRLVEALERGQNGKDPT